MKIGKWNFGVAATMLLVAGCGTLIPSEHKEQVAVRTAGELAATHSANVTKQSENVAPPMNLSISGKDNKLDLKVESARTSTKVEAADTQDSSGHDSAFGSSMHTIPLFVKLIGAAIGLGLLFFVIKWIVSYLRKSSPAIDAAFQAGDELAAKWINEARHEAMATTDPNALAKLNARIAQMEADRGKFNAT